MRTLNYSLFALILMITAACGPNTQALMDAENALHDEVMDIHDEVMPKMSDINRLYRELNDYAEANADNITPEMAGRIENTLRELEQADDGMMGWMNSYRQLDALRETMDHEGIMNYLNEEKENIQKVSDQMRSSISNGQTLKEELDI